jgi:hypothetical protein
VPPVDHVLADGPAAGERYLLLADISGYTSFMAGVEEAHGVDFSEGIPAAYAVLGALLDAISDGVQPAFSVVKYEGDAVFAAAPATALDDEGQRVVDALIGVYGAFKERRATAFAASDELCTACPAVAGLDLKMVLHRGQSVRQTVGSGSDLLGPAVNTAHRLLKNSIRTWLGHRPYLFITDAAAGGLGLPALGTAHRETYPGIGVVEGRVVDLADADHWAAGGIEVRELRLID